MLELLFSVMMNVIFGKLFIFGVKATWGITKILVTVVFLPLILIGLSGEEASTQTPSLYIFNL